MSENNAIRHKVSSSYSPMVVVVISILATLTTIGSVLALIKISAIQTAGPTAVEIDAGMMRLIAHPWLSVLLGIAIGLPYMLREKHSLRKHREHHIESAILTHEERRNKPFYIPDVVDCVFVVLTPATAAGLAYLLHIAIMPAFLAPGLLAFLAYPEMKDIYYTAQSRLREYSNID